MIFQKSAILKLANCQLLINILLYLDSCLTYLSRWLAFFIKIHWTLFHAICSCTITNISIIYKMVNCPHVYVCFKDLIFPVFRWNSKINRQIFTHVIDLLAPCSFYMYCKTQKSDNALPKYVIY